MNSQPDAQRGPAQVLDRRPIASRKHGIWIAAAHWLVRRGVSANAISVVGMICAIVAAAAAVSTNFAGGWPARALWLAVAAGVQLRLLANMLDGMVAVESGTASPVGELFNEVPDRVSDAAVLLGIGYAANGSAELGYIAALLAVATAYIRAECKVAGAPQDFCGPMAKPHRMFLITVAAVAMAVLPATRLAEMHWKRLGIPAAVLAIISAGCVVTIVRRLVRGVLALTHNQPRG